jgi:hypothetical protein
LSLGVAFRRLDSGSWGRGAAKTQPSSQKATVSSSGTTAAHEIETRSESVVNAGLRPSDAVNATVHVDGLRPGDVHRLRRVA